MRQITVQSIVHVIIQEKQDVQPIAFGDMTTSANALTLLQCKFKKMDQCYS